MPPHLPLVAVSRSQAIRIGRGPGSAVVPPFNMGDIATNPETGGLYSLLYADLGNPQVRRDVQHHSAEGAIETVAGAASNTTWTDLYRLSSTGLVVSSGSNFTISVTPQTTSLAAPLIASRFYGALANAPVTQPGGVALGAGTNLASLTLATPDPVLDRYDQVYVAPNGQLGIQTGMPVAAAVQTVFTITAVGSPAAGSFKISWNYAGYPYTSGSIAYGATGAAVVTGLLAAANGAATQPPTIPTAGFTGSATTLPAATTITSSVAVGGPITNLTVTENSMTASTNYALAVTTQGSGPLPFVPAGVNLPLCNVFVPHAAANAAACTFTNLYITA